MDPFKIDTVHHIAVVNTTNGWNKRIVFFYVPDGTPLELHE